MHSDGIEPEVYALALLNAALERTPGRYQLQPTPQPMAQSRASLAIENDSKSVQVMWTMTTREREERLLPIRIPIYRGLIGWRVLLQRSDNAEQLAAVRSLDQLKRFSFGQRHDWPDTAILRINGLKVVTSQHYPGLFQMLAAGRFDLFPREVVVAWQEQALARENGLDLSIDNYLLLHYPTAFYFFTSRNRPDLAADIERGLEAMIADGSFQRLFEQYHGDTLRQARLHKRHIIELHNPDLPPATPFSRKALWFQPEEFK
jgi:ABC-type amino acid transport substrate-binding protein